MSYYPLIREGKIKGPDKDLVVKEDVVREVPVVKPVLVRVVTFGLTPLNE